VAKESILYLTENDVKHCMSVAEGVALAEKGIRADAAGEVAGDKFYMHIGEAGFLKPFSGYLAGEQYAFVKTFTFFEGNPARGIPATDSMVLLLDAETGLPVCIMEAAWITALKTGASTTVAAKYLARPNSKVATIFGAGGLGRTHLLGLAEVFDLDEVRVVDIVPEAAETFAAEMGQQTGLPIVIASSPEAAVRGADIICTVTTGSAVNVEVPWVKPGAFIARLGSYQEVPPELFARADKLVVDRWGYVSYRIPEMVQLIREGKLRREDVHAEWPDIVGGRATGRESDDEVILYVALGIWGEYAAILPQVYRRARELGLGKAIAESSH
jgi:ornithine cyclodeaminase/alanine dehydrogenase-like protein (mu-crystallin family)